MQAINKNNSKILFFYSIPILGWILALFMLGFMFLMFHTFTTNRGFGQFDYELEIIIYGLFMFTFGSVVIYAINTPVTIISHKNNGLYVKSITIFGIKSHHGDMSDFSTYIQKSIDTDGDELYKCFLRHKSGQETLFATCTESEKSIKLVQRIGVSQI